MSRVLFLSRVLLLEAQQEQTSKLRIFLIKLSHSSSTDENTFAFQHFIDRRKTIIFGLKERAIPFAYSVRTVLGSSRSSSVIWRLFNVLTPSLYSVRCLTVLVLLSFVIDIIYGFVLKLTTQIGFDKKIKIKSLAPCLILLIYLDQKPVIKFAWPYIFGYINYVTNINFVQYLITNDII